MNTQVKNILNFWRNAGYYILLALLFVQCAKSPVVSNDKPKKNAEAALSDGDERKFKILFFDASRAKILGNYKEAKSLFNAALAVDPTSNPVKYELAKLLAEEGNLPLAVDFMANVVESEPRNVWYAQFLAQLYAEVGNLPKSIEIVEQIIENNPDQYAYYFSLGGLLAAEGAYDEALKLYDQLESLTGLNEELSMQRQLIYMEKGDNVAALKEVDNLIAANPGEIRYYGMKAEILMELGRQQEAVAIFENMLELDPANGIVLLALFEIAQNDGDIEKAKNYLGQAFESDDLNIDVKVNILLNMLSAQGAQEEKDFIKALGSKLEKSHSDDAKAFAIQGDIYYNLEELEKSREKFRQAVALDPNRPPIWQQILTISSQLNDFESMEKESSQGMELFPQLPIFYLFNGVAQLQLDRPEEAIEALNTGRNLVIDNKEALTQFYTSLGDAYHATEQHKKSDEAYDMALKNDPSNVLVLNNYAYYLSLRNEQLERAETMAKKANDLSPDMASFQDTYGWVLYMRGNYKNAVFWLQQAITNGGDKDPTVLEHYGDALNKVDRTEEALTYWQRAIDAGGDADSIQLKIGQKAND